MYISENVEEMREKMIYYEVNGFVKIEKSVAMCGVAYPPIRRYVSFCNQI